MLSARQVAQDFEQHYGRPPLAAGFAPGRVNLIGEHIDYAGGCCLPFAIQLGVTIAIAPGSAAVSRIFSEGVTVGTETCALSSLRPHCRLVSQLQQALGRRGSYDIFAASDLPAGLGLSSSAAFELALAAALLGCRDAGAPQQDSIPLPAPLTLARLCQQAELAALGTRCGLLDQLASLHGRAGRALLLDCRSLALRPITFPAGKLRVLLFDSAEPRTLAASGYNQRRSELDAALAAVGLYGADAAAEARRAEALAQHDQLQARRRGLSLHSPPPAADSAPEAQNEVEASGAAASPDPSLRHWRDLPASEVLSRGPQLPAPLRSRLMHLISEQTRVENFAAELESGSLGGLAGLLGASHASLSSDYDVSTAKVDAIVEALAKLDGSRGARIHGGGFGGGVLALIDANAEAGLEGQLAGDSLLSGLSWLELRPSSGALLWPGPEAAFDATGQALLQFLPADDDA